MWVSTPTESRNAPALLGLTRSALAPGASAIEQAPAASSPAKTPRIRLPIGPGRPEVGRRYAAPDECTALGADTRTIRRHAWYRAGPRLPAGPARRGAHLCRHDRRVARGADLHAALRRAGNAGALRRPVGHDFGAAAPRR